MTMQRGIEIVAVTAWIAFMLGWAYLAGAFA
jgi:hypothetical protein